MNVGLVGTGNISLTHGRAAREAGLTVSAVYGRSLERAQSLARECGGVAFNNLEACLAYRPLDFVIIGTASGVHAEQAIVAVRQGVPVLVEKPADITVERVDSLIAEADVAGVPVGVCFQDRFVADVETAHRLITTGALGRILFVDARVPWYRPPSYYAASNWRGTWAFDGGGALMNQGSHTVDLLVHLLGDVARVSARTATLRHAVDVEDTAMALLEFESGALGTLTVTTAAYPGYARQLLIAGTAGSLTFERDALVAADFVQDRPADLVVRPRVAEDGRSSTPVIADVSSHRAAIEDFGRVVRLGGRPRCDIRDGRRSVALIRAIYDASATGSSVVPSRRSD